MLLSVSSYRRGLRRACGLVLALWLVPAAVQSQPVNVAGTLPEDYFPVLRTLLETAMKQSPAMLEKQLEIVQQQARIDEVDSARWPKLNGIVDYASSQAAISGDNGRTDRNHGLFYRFELSQPLFHWGAIRNNSERARLGIAMSEKNYLEAYRLLASQLRATYLLLVEKKAGLRHARERQRLREVALELARDKYARGLVAEGEVGGALISIEENAVNILRSEIEFDSMRRMLARLAGVPEVKEEDIAADLPEPKYSPELASRLLATFLRDRAASSFVVQVYELQLRDADLAYRIARVRQLPKFNASAGHEVVNTTNITGNGVSQEGVQRQSMGVRADWSIFDGFATRGAKREALAARRITERRLANTAEIAMEEAQKLERLLTVDAQAMQFADKRRALAHAMLSRIKQEVERGNVAPGRAEQEEANVYAGIAASAGARSMLLIHWSDFVSVTGADPMLKTIADRYAREKR